ncbi:hypothetical protein MBLNU13_g02561t1 [Cladosporium sp. NU13]
MFLNQSIRPREWWKAVEGGHDGIHFRSVGHWSLLNRSDPAGPMHQVLEPSDPSPSSSQTFTPAVLHPVFVNGPWDRASRMEAFSSLPLASRFGPQRWESAVILPAMAEQSAREPSNALLNAFTSDPRCFQADVRLSYGMKSGLFHSKSRHIQSAQGLKIKDVYGTLNELSGELYRELVSQEKQNSIRMELRIFMPSDIRPVTDQEWEYVRAMGVKAVKF